VDLSSLQQNDSAEIGILHPSTGEDLGITITVASIDSKTYRKAQHEQANAQIGQMAAKGAKGVAVTAEVVEERGLALLTKCTLGWRGVEFEGKTLECTPENVRMVYDQFPWIREQVDRAIANRSHFFKRPASAS
jgi:hypothetical protein